MMNRRIFIRNIAAGTAGLTLGAAPLKLLASDEFVTISIMHTNDIHSHIEPFESNNKRYSQKGGLARISEIVKEQRKINPGTFLFDAGDMFQGTPYFNYFKGELMFKTMSAMGYDLGTIGNHEFDNGLQGILEPLPHLKFPLITSNYDFSDTILAGKFEKYKIYKQQGIKIGVYALGVELKGLVAEKNYGKTVYNNPVTVAREMEEFLKKEKECDLVVCLSHLGLEYSNDKVSDKVIADETFYTDLIIGGHTHTYLKEPLLRTNKAGQQIIVNQAWWGGLVMGKIDFVFSRSDKKQIAAYSKNIG